MNWRALTVAVPFFPALDPLGHTALLNQQAHFPLLGLPLVVRSNSPAVIAAAWRSFGHWRGLAKEDIEPREPLEVAIVVHPADHRSNQPEPFIYRVHGDCFLAASGSNLLTAQRDRGIALGFVTPELVAEDEYFRRSVLECLALALASRHDRTPVHGAGLLRNGRALLLLGGSLAGKSTLCYACLREGFGLLAEDVVFVSTRGGFRLWGSSRQIHLGPEVQHLFPELSGIAPKRLANGKVKLAVELPPSLNGSPKPHSGPATVCLMERRPDHESTLEPLDLHLLLQELGKRADPGFDLDPRMPEVVASLARGGPYRLTNGRDVQGAVALLQRLTD
jgi:hypothetical protein